jgi:hypothetical protein
MKKTICLYGFLIFCFILLLFSSCSVLNELDVNVPGQSVQLTESEIVAGLTEALDIGIDKAVGNASITDGFYKNEAIFIPFPMEAYKVRQAAMDFHLDAQVQKFEETLNRAAENAASRVKPIFVNALKQMTFNDAKAILRGDDNAATEYFRRTTNEDLMRICYPEIEKATSQVQLTKHWEPIIKVYNKARIISGDPEINPDLNAYVTQKTIDGLFKLIEQEEMQIRKNPEKRVTELLKKVFGSL